MLTKLVNGRRVPVPADEEAAILDEWAKPPPAPPTLRETIIARLRGDPATRAQFFETRDSLGLTTAQTLDRWEANAQESV